MPCPPQTFALTVPHLLEWRTGIDQRLDRADVSLVRRAMQSGRALVVAHGEGGASAREDLHSLCMTSTRGDHERRPAEFGEALEVRGVSGGRFEQRLERLDVAIICSRVQQLERPVALLLFGWHDCAAIRVALGLQA